MTKQQQIDLTNLLIKKEKYETFRANCNDDCKLYDDYDLNTELGGMIEYINDDIDNLKIDN